MINWVKLKGFAKVEVPYRLIKSRWLVGTDDLFTVETIHSSRVRSLKILDFFSKFWILIDDNLIKKLKRIS